jgi:hypothetical protein
MTEAGKGFCSDYCRQAASQGVEKDFCQCEHANCEKPASNLHLLAGVGLPESIFVTPGRVTIECGDVEDLLGQLKLLAKALDDNYETLRLNMNPAPRRRPMSSEAPAPAVRVQSA